MKRLFISLLFICCSCLLQAKVYRKAEVKPLIVIDAGHGGKNLGTHKKAPFYQEKILTLKTAKAVKSYLKQLGYRVAMTRQDDTFVSLNKRAEYANEMQANLFVSIHYNSASLKQANGIEVFYYDASKKKKSNIERTKKSKRLAENVLGRLIYSTQANSRGVKHGNYAVIRKTKMPAILVEGGFLTNDSERQKLLSVRYRQRLAWAIAKGIDDYMKGKKPLKIKK